ncbi:helix-turn-helix domain-containing protein [Clostridium botulinum]|uniref:helix-turn-helix domain-containing protein n=1 Tax=Clostridium botulinum TaxID=1491 RepID=UPI000772E72B|nr:helix-turn-helix domain-containing protein [Clostridium botulinum]MBN1067146.1 DNA-binding protein [Clostridium botulinum]NFE74413.1 helix-turn-helix domain-containing protein [Clostridium botulinum]NFH79951.1 helix-turn-helix domain-containing protein [Clostridium botulinum]NFH84466.1 helix-turn-helix domain-containing protein [Clostridium botulinum]NFI11535.1 helix-turn-helix domain-containing protein [Clostridium botulinum]
MELLTIKEVSKKLKINATDTYKLIKSGHIKALKLGSLKVASCELDRFILQSIGKDYSDLKGVTNLILN